MVVGFMAKPVPEIISQFRRQNAHKSFDQLVSLYYGLLEQAEESRRKKQFDIMVHLLTKSLPLIEPLIIHTKAEYGTFDISEIPAIEWIDLT